MKKGIILSLFLLLNFSCQSEKTQELEQKVSELEKKNEELQYYLDNSEYISIVNSQLRGIPELRNFKVNEKGIINFGFWKYGDIKNYKIYMKRKGDENFDLIYDNLSNAQFKLEFTPKSLEDNQIELFAEFEEKSEKGDSIIRIPTKMNLNIAE